MAFSLLLTSRQRCYTWQVICKSFPWKFFFQQTRRVLAAVDTIHQPPITLFSHCFIEKTQRLHHKRTMEGGREERGGGHFPLFTLAKDFSEVLLILCSFRTWWMWLCPSHGQTRVGHVLGHLGPLISVKKISHVFVTLSERRHVVGIWGSHWRITRLILVRVTPFVRHVSLTRGTSIPRLQRDSRGSNRQEIIISNK